MGPVPIVNNIIVFILSDAKAYSHVYEEADSKLLRLSKTNNIVRLSKRPSVLRPLEAL